MKTICKLLCLFLIIPLLLTLAAPCALAASEDSCDVLLVGDLSYTKAFEVLELVNDLRASLGVHELIMDETLLEYAMLRATELALHFSHTRPDGSSFDSGCSSARGENIACGYRDYTTAEDVFNGWYNSPGHYQNMVRENFHSIGVGMFQIGSDYYWVQVFGLDSGTEILVSDCTDTYISTTVTILDDTVKDIMDPVMNKTALQIGDRVEINMDCSTVNSYYLPYWGLSYKSSDDSVCTVDKDGIVTATGAGAATVSLWYPGLESDPWTFDITVCGDHSWDEGVITTEPSCKNTGIRTVTCTVCAATGVEYIDMLDHTWDEGTVITPPSLNADGKILYACTVCGSTKTESISLPAEDVNGDGYVTPADAVCLMKFIVDVDVTVNPNALDLNGDGRTDILDVLVLLRRLAES